MKSRKFKVIPPPVPALLATYQINEMCPPRNSNHQVARPEKAFSHEPDKEKCRVGNSIVQSLGGFSPAYSIWTSLTLIILPPSNICKSLSSVLLDPACNLTSTIF